MTENGDVRLPRTKRGRPSVTLTEDRRYILYRVGAHSAWWGALAWLTALTAVNLVRDSALPPNAFQRLSGIMIVMLIGIGIAFGSALSRMRLADTIATTFETGLKVATVLQTNVSAAACVIETDLDAVIQTVEHAEVIGWERDHLIGAHLDVLIPDRFLRRHHEGFKHFKESGESRVQGRTINVPVLTQGGAELPMRLSVARLGDSFIGTLVPSGSLEYSTNEETQQ